MATLAVNVERVNAERENVERVNVDRVLPGMSRADLQTDLARARWLADLLDTRFSIAGFRFGIDPLVDLIPVLGDTIMFVAGLYPLHVARKHKLGWLVQWRMFGNLVLDYLVGIIPFIGAFFDAAFKANVKNYQLLERAVQKRSKQR
jgi:hypothetical protein